MIQREGMASRMVQCNKIVNLKVLVVVKCLALYEILHQQSVKA